MLCGQQARVPNIMADLQWLVTPGVAFIAVIVAIYFGIQNLRTIITQRERDAAFASGRLDARLENLEQLVRAVDENLRAMNEKLDAHDVLLRQVRREAKKQNRRLRKLRRRVEALESKSTVPPKYPTSSEAQTESQAVKSQSPRLTEVPREGSAGGRSGRAM